MEETLKEPDRSLERDEPISRLSQLVVAASEACRRGSSDVPASMAALPQALAAKCTRCGFALSGKELLALARISAANEQSALLKRLRAGHCAREGCSASHYRLLFYDTPQINWSTLLAKAVPKPQPQRPQLAPQPNPLRVLKPVPTRQIPSLKFATIAGAPIACLLVWMWWQWHIGGRIPLLREPEHFKVTPGKVDQSNQ